MPSRYTVFGSDDFEKKIHNHMMEISDRVAAVFQGDDLVALILGGGYGRGEGSVYVRDSEELPFNDYDFFVIVKPISKARKKKYHQKLEHLKLELEEKCEIDVDFEWLDTIDKLQSLPPMLMTYELRYGHKVLIGPENILSGIGPERASSIPFVDGLRVLLNRATGLFLCEAKIIKNHLSEQEKHFIMRNIHKAVLAMGDVFLMIHKEYNFSYRIRLDMLAKYEQHEIVKKLGLVDDYAKAIDYQLKPTDHKEDVADLERWFVRVKRAYKEVYYRAFEEFFGEYKFNKLGYLQCVYKWNQCRFCPVVFGVNVVKNVKEFGFENFTLHWTLRHPRQRLFYALPNLLFDDQAASRDTICKALSLPKGTDKQNMEIKFVSIWERFR